MAGRAGLVELVKRPQVWPDIDQEAIVYHISQNRDAQSRHAFAANEEPSAGAVGVCGHVEVGQNADEGLFEQAQKSFGRAAQSREIAHEVAGQLAGQVEPAATAAREEAG